MGEKKQDQKEFSARLEEIPFAEMMGQKGVAAEIMREMIVLDDCQIWFLAQVSAHHRARS